MSVPVVHTPPVHVPHVKPAVVPVATKNNSAPTAEVKETPPKGVNKLV